MAQAPVRVLVVGASVAGLATARALRLAGLRPEVVEKLAPSVVAGAGIFLPGNAIRSLRDLGLDNPLRPLGAVIRRQRFLDSTGDELCAVDLERLWQGVGESRALPRADLHQVLLTGAGGEVRFNTEVRDLEVGDETTKVAFGDGSYAEYDLVVGADGRRSAIRRLADLGGAPHPVGQIAYRSVVTGGPKVTDWTALLGQRSGIVLSPMGYGRIYLYADEPLPAGAAPPADPLVRLRELFGGYGGPVPALLDAVEKVQVAVTDEVELSNWSRGNVVLVGDAAHATAPTLSQGAAMAFEDALVLAEALRTHATVTEGLAGYESRRRPRTQWVLDRTRDRDRTRNVAPGLRDPLLRAKGGRIFQEHYRLLVDPV
ncbi:FAD-dependent monooxygenase [Micromonospora sp. NBC_01813]|uniref:FAD-dependent monooxygenase n=1 Tax=Micromonospora sp. NBC_01813 TaxID=2975988 RepID=UPI002DD8526C|nr:FAD-dependent monooxygenase [Micromonospora sp. NBC_01813]WSA12133.1 FAD-dependent monooxygenase [Micromonospora sp. NBC_01813]